MYCQRVLISCYKFEMVSASSCNESKVVTWFKMDFQFDLMNASLFHIEQYIYIIHNGYFTQMKYNEIMTELISRYNLYLIMTQTTHFIYQIIIIMGCGSSKAEEPKLHIATYDKQGTQGQQDQEEKQQNNEGENEHHYNLPQDTPSHKRNLVEHSFQQTAPQSNSTNKEAWKSQFMEQPQPKQEVLKQIPPVETIEESPVKVQSEAPVVKVPDQKEEVISKFAERKESPVGRGRAEPVKQVCLTSPKKVNLLELLKKKKCETPSSQSHVNILSLLKEKRQEEERFKKSLVLPPPMFYEESRQDISPIYADTSKEKQSSLRPFENDTQEKSFLLFPSEHLDDLSRFQLRVETLNVSYQESGSGSKLEKDKQFFLNVPEQGEDVNSSILTPTYPYLDQKKEEKQQMEVPQRSNDERCPSFCIADSNQFVQESQRPPGQHKIQHRATIETSFLERSKDESGKKKINHYVILNELGRGGFGKVKLVYNSNDSQYYAMKQANKSKLRKKLLTRTKSVYTLLEQEIAIMKKVDHPNVVKLYEVIDDPDEDKLYMVMEYVKKGQVHQDMIQKYLRDFLLGLNYLHNYCRIIHRDIKPDNLLIDPQGNLKIADFGLAKILDDTDIIKDESGTKAFLSPEFFQGKLVKGKSADIWAAGVTFYKLAYDKMPFMAPRLDELKEAIINQEVIFPDDSDPQLVDLLRSCLDKNPQKRIQLEELMEHPYVTSNGLLPLMEQDYDDKMILLDQDIRKAITRLTFRASVIITAKLKKQLQLSRQRIKSRTLHKSKAQ